jgi:hypothetical protein
MTKKQAPDLPALNRSGVLSVRMQHDLLQVLSQRADGLAAEGDTAGALRQVGVAHQAELAKVSIGTANPPLLAGLPPKPKDLARGARLRPGAGGGGSTRASDYAGRESHCPRA